MRVFFIKKISLAVSCIVALCLLVTSAIIFAPKMTVLTASNNVSEMSYIKWIEFNPTASAMSRALDYDIKSHDQNIKISWIELLAYLAAKYGGSFDGYENSDMDKLVTSLQSGKAMAELTEKMKYYNFYLEGFTAILGGMVGDYEIETEQNGQKVMQRKYGLKAYSPIARGYSFSHYDDFGNSRSYGFKRRHLGNDLMGNVGAPIVAVESGIVEALGWNQYGGWRIGIRSADGYRYYYYAHLRKDKPFHASMYIGKKVTAGDVIGYLGMSGYSTSENVNNINIPHLHFGMQLIFDESQKDSVNEIWIDVYDVVELLQKNKSAVVKNGSGDFDRVYQMNDPDVYE